MKILIVKLSSFGDIIHCLPVLTSLKKKFPEAEISWLVSQKNAELLRGHKSLNRVYELPREIINWKKIIIELKKQNFDLVLEMQGLIKTSLLSFLLSPRKIIGLNPARENLASIFWTEKISSTKVLDQKIHVIRRNLDILKYFGFDPSDEIKDISFDLPINSDLPNILRNQNFIVCAPETRWQTKTWPTDYWLKLIAGIQGINNHKIVLLGSNPSLIEVKPDSRIINLMGKTNLSQLMSIIPRARAVIGLDSGIIHLASAYGVETLALYGATSPLRTGPWQGNYQWLELNCSPCHKRKCPLKGIDELRCLNDLAPEMVLRKVQELLK